MTERQYAPGEVIYQEGDKSDFAYVIRSGRVEILKSEDGEARQITVLGEDDVFGEMGIVLDQRRSVTARALDQVALRAISRASFLHAINQQPDMARPMLKMLLARLHAEEAPSATVTPLPGVGKARDDRMDGRREHQSEHEREQGAEEEPAEAPRAPRIRLLPASEYL
ncbi:MAG: cyclic nucleotide-binding domain-containing protein, partial [Alphaproteobacteria bacterium]